VPNPILIDAVTLRHFGIIRRLDIIEARVINFPGPKWVQEVFDEIHIARGLPECDQVLAAKFLGDPLQASTSDLRQIYLLQVALNAGKRPPTDHLGEAASMHHADKLGGVFVTDDNVAYDFASRRLGPGRVMDTVDVLRQAVAIGDLVASTAQQAADAVRNSGRSLRRVHPETFPRGYFSQ
jgi:hypothetical protein